MDILENSKDNKMRISSKKILYCIVGTGRNGSSLLCSSLYGLGYNFGKTFVDSWKASSGNYEHPTLHNAYASLSRSEALKIFPFTNWLSLYFRKKAKLQLSELIKTVDCLKSSKLLWLIPLIDKNIEIRMVILIRDFNEYSFSRYQRFGQTFAQIERDFIKTYKQLWFYYNTHNSIILNFNNFITGFSSEQTNKLSSFLQADKTLLKQKLSENFDKNYQTKINKKNTESYSHKADNLFLKLNEYAI